LVDRYTKLSSRNIYTAYYSNIYVVAPVYTVVIMRFSTPASLLSLAAASTVSAQAQYTNQSAPFTLQVANSANASLDGAYFFACHAGAAIEGICLSTTNVSAASTTFYFNTTDTDSTEGAGSDTSQGVLVWNLPLSSGIDGVDHVSQAASFPFPAGSNVVVPTFGFGQGEVVQFTDGNNLTIRSWNHDQDYVQGEFPTSSSEPTDLSNWYVCWTGVGVGYTYEALVWVTAGEPLNPTCQKIDVVRTFL
jgi:hypothetical protein